MTATGRGSDTDWRPTACREMLQLRAALLARTRGFFAARGVLEVDTPIVVNAPVTDVHIHSARVLLEPADPEEAARRPYFLHTSPEYAMKRLLAAGAGDIYQICHVVRALERGRLHNAEFTLIEWYRVGYSLDALMSEVGALVHELLGRSQVPPVTERLSYREAFLRALALDPFTAPLAQLAEQARLAGFDGMATDRDELLELLMGTVVGPRLGHGGLTFVQAYPASQAALARLDPSDPRAAQRFELYCDGVELANGFHELAAASEQRARFEHDVAERRRLGLPVASLDERLLAALEAGLPDCCGVALGFDRTLMLAAGAERIDAVLPFPIERA
ncbi:MAG TPA: EF-P lysine aminoacylase EpmA [Steroidobacteraceae bacterium]|jgi:lysyl-tRNA synthetase class 2|nr:EF-P lysine aminoacylase EpmA [Steroidobacteraceae bacterium]